MPAFNPQGFGSGFDGGVNTPASGSGAFYSGAFGAGFDGGADTTAGTGGAFNSAGFGGGFYGGVNTATGGTGGPLSSEDIAAIAAAVRAELAPELAQLTKVSKIHGVGVPLVVTATSRTAGDLSQTISTTGGTTTVSAA